MSSGEGGAPPAAAEDAAAAAPPAARVRFTEGSVELPGGYEDRTTNLLVPPNIQVQPNLSVARDWMKPGEALPAYVDRQMGLLRSQLAGHRVLSRHEAWLGEPPAAGAEGAAVADAAAGSETAAAAAAPTAAPGAAAPAGLAGLRIDACYRNGKLMIYQRQAAFEPSPSRVLVFTASKAGGFGDDFEELWTRWLASYQPPPAEDIATNAPDLAKA